VRALFLAGVLAALLCSSTAYPRFRFQGDISGSWQYSDNINSSSTNPFPDNIWTVSPSVSLTKANAQQSIVANFSFSTRNFLKMSIQNRDTYTGGLSGHYVFSRRTSVDFYDTLSYSPQVTTQTANFEQVLTDAGIITELVTRNIPSSLVNNEVGASVTHDLTRRTTLTFGGTTKLSRYSSKVFDNTDDWSVRGGVRYKLSSRDDLNFAVTHGFRSFGNKITDSNTNTAALTWYRDLTRVFRSKVNVNVIDDQTKAFASNTITGTRLAQIQVGGVYTIDPNTQLTAMVGEAFAKGIGNSNQTNGGNINTASIYDFLLTRRYVRSSIMAELRRTFNTGYTTGFSTTFGSIAYSYQLTPDLVVDGTLSRSSSKIPGSAGTGSTTTTTTALYLRLNYKIDRRTFFSVVYSGASQTSKGGGGGGSIKQNSIVFSIDIMDLTRRP